jgi:hypothetical protein
VMVVMVVVESGEPVNIRRQNTETKTR